MTDSLPLVEAEQNHDTPLSLTRSLKKVSPHWPKALVQAVKAPASVNNLSDGSVASKNEPR